MKYLKSSLIAIGIVLTAAAQASAASITFSLNCQFSGVASDGNCQSSGSSFGTVTLSDRPGGTNTVAAENYLDILVTLNAGWAPSALYLNIAPGSLPAGYNTWVMISGTTGAPTLNTDASGNTWLYFDLSIEATKPNPNPWNATIGLNNGAKAPNPLLWADLVPSMFAVITNDPQAAGPPNTALVYLAVNQINSASGAQQVIGSTSIVPEPASLLLFGSGLSALGIHARRRRNRNRA